MPVLRAYNISHQFDNGDTPFKNISCSMSQRRVGLVGRNGVGKSLFASILTGEITPSDGTISLPSSYAFYRQQPSELLSSKITVAQFLGKDKVIEALNRIEAGDISEHWFELVGEQWDLAIRLESQLRKIGLPPQLDTFCSQLSGGQLARLQLWQLFEQDVDLLVLDEPSNHFDTNAKLWLVEAIRCFDGAILLISHDRELLRHMDEIWELSGLGLSVFGGNYDDYAEHKRTELKAVERHLANITKQAKSIEQQAQRNREKAEQRAAQGNKQRKQGSQPKILLDAKKDQATARASNRSKNERLRQASLQEKAQRLESRKEQLESQKLYLADSQSTSKKVVSVLEGRLPFGHQSPITLQIRSDEKLHLVGDNGSGKSTLLKVLLGELALSQGELQINTSLFYLDQHFGGIDAELSILENLMQQCAGMQESDARTLLAGIGFRRDQVFRLAKVLSGGEKMKLAMLIVSHQPTQPLLLLDEPDNHLDLDSKMMLASALNNYKGGFVLVSHDQDFSKESGVTRQFHL